MKNTNISQYGCSTLGEEIERNEILRRIDIRLGAIVGTLVFIGILLTISFLTIPR
jgi:hypothetical protein